jgi:hypothetical protein
VGSATWRGNGSEVETRVDDPIRPSEVLSVEARVDVPIRPGEEKAKVVICFRTLCICTRGVAEILVVARRRRS